MPPPQCQVRVMDEGKDSKAGGKQKFINNNINKTNKNYPVGERGAGQGRAGQGRAGQGRAGQGRAGQGTNHIRHLTYGNEPTRNCKHK